MIPVNEIPSFKTIQEEYNETILWVEQRVLALWLFISIKFTDIMIYDSNGLSAMRNFMLQNFEITLTFQEIWLIWYMILFLICLFCLSLFDIALEIIYRIKPNWW